MRFSFLLLSAWASFALSAEHASSEPALQGVRQITFSGTKNGEAYFSADGSRIVFQGVRENENPFYQIYSMELEPRKAAGAKLISSGIGRTTCAFFHPTKNRMLFSSTHLDPESTKKQRDEIEKLKHGPPKRYAWDFDPELDIFETDLDGGHSIQLTSEKGYDAEGSYSPDGTRIVFCSMRDGDGEIYVMNSDGSHPARLTAEKGYDGGPFFSPDGKRIVWRHFADEAQKCAEIWIMDADGSNKKQITNFDAITWAPYWHPNGEWLVFASNFEDPAFDIYAIKTDGTGLTRITNSPGFDGLPVISPDGSTLMWTSNRADNRSQIFMAGLVLAGADSKAARPATQGTKDDEQRKRRAELLKASHSADLEHEIAREFKRTGLKPIGREKIDAETEFIYGPSVGGWRSSNSANCILALGLLNVDTDNARSVSALLQAVRESVRNGAGIVAFAAQQDELSRALPQAENDLKPAGKRVAAGVSFANLVQREFSSSDENSALLPTLLLRGGGTSPAWRKLAELLALRHPAIHVRVEDDPAGAELPQFVAAKVPCISLEALLPGRKIALEGEQATLQAAQMSQELDLCTAAAVDLVGLIQGGSIRLEFTPYDAAAIKAARTANARPYLGTIPEYKSDGVSGVKLKGTREGSPAEKAGIKADDVLVELDGKPIKDVETYLQVLEALKPGVEVKLKVQRAGEAVELTITPGTR